MVRACYISKPITYGQDTSILNDMTKVSVANNEILRAIMRAQESWSASPIIWAGQYPYKIKIIKKSQDYVLMYQMFIEFPSEKVYKVKNIRKVKIVY